MRQNEFDCSNIYADGDGARPLCCPVTIEANEPLAIEGRHIALAELPLQQFQRGGLGAQRSLADVAHVVDMKVNEFPECCQPRDARLVRSLATINLALGLGASAAHSGIETWRNGACHSV